MPASTQKTKSRKRKSSVASNLFLVLILLLGAGIMAYPTVSDWWNSFHQSRAIASYVSQIENVDDSEVQAIIEAASAYNKKILQKKNRYAMTDEDLAEYNSLLDLTGTGVMGYIQIPSINVNLPIYHGTEESVLQVAAGHINWTSLPVGGESTHAVMSGHRGLPSAKLFTDLDRVVPGDTFTINVLKTTLTYMVDQIRIVEPDDTSELQVVEGKDYVTLVTCTPYGINTHRMLVRGHRIENPEAPREVVVTVGAIRIPNTLSIPVIAIPLLFIFLVILLLWERVRRGKYTDVDIEKMFEESPPTADSPKKRRKK